MARPALGVALLAAALLAAAGEAPRCPPLQPCEERGAAFHEYFYGVRGQPLMIVYVEAQHLRLTCREELQLEDAALPAFAADTPVPTVTLTACAPPAAGYGRALRALNVTGVSALALQRLPPRSALAARHLSDLPQLRGLRVEGNALLQPAAGWLRDAAGLLDLRLDRVALEPKDLLELPPGLEALEYERFGGGAVPAAALARLPRLARLVVRDDRLRELDAAAAQALRNLTAAGPLVRLALGPAVRSLELTDAMTAELGGNCSGLLVLRLRNVTGPLPAGWLARYGTVRELSLRNMGAGAVGAAELAGAGALRRLQAVRCELRAPAPLWLADARELRALDVSYNRLERLPGALPPTLEELAASDNRLDAGALAALAALPALRVLMLDRNPLADLCGASDSLDPNTLSPLHGARALRRLSLRAAGVRRVCRDWRSLPRLDELDLRNNHIAALGRADLQWQRDKAATVDLRGNPVSVLYTRADYEAALLARPAPDAPATTLRIDGAVRCNCSDYWFARALRERPDHVRAVLNELLCATDKAAVPLREMPPDELACDVPQAQGCPERCRCRATGAAAELRCERAGLRAVPRAPLLPPPRLLLLAGNNISRVSLEDVPPSVELLDLRNNSLSLPEPALLSARATRLLLVGNPLDCSCGALPGMRALAAAHAAGRAPDLRDARCSNGRRAADAAAGAPADCARPPAWAVALAALALALAAAVVAAYLARPAARHRLKRFLFERGLCLPWLLRPLGADAERPYDAFVAFAHRDRRYAYELARRLEAGAARRLCLHERDWVPGEWIPAQIARSVRRSQRTLVLLSDHFLASAWARAELREAYGAALREERPRLLLLLLPELAEEEARADPQLRAYLASVTYLRWEEPRFWEKLALALPPRATPASPAPTPLPLPLPPPLPPPLPLPDTPRQ